MNVLEVDTDDYYKSVNEVIEFLKNTKLIKLDYIDEENDFDGRFKINKPKHIEYLIKEVETAMDNSSTPSFLINQLEKNMNTKNWDFIKENWDEIKAILNTFWVDKYAQQKLRQKNSQSKYYFKKKDALGKVKKPTLTPEEKAEKYKEQIRKANLRYYEKKRTELIELGVMKEKQTEEEKKQLIKERNSINYKNRKEQQKELKKIELKEIDT
jgi:hypothetical protein